MPMDNKWKYWINEYNLLNPIYTLTGYSNSECMICDKYVADINELYKENPLFEAGGYCNTMYGLQVQVENAMHNARKTDDNDGRFAFFILDGKSIVSYPSYTITGPNSQYWDFSEYYTWVPQQTDSSHGSCPASFLTDSETYPWFYKITTNVPIFETEADAITYVGTGQGLTEAINYDTGAYDPTKTKSYFYSAKHNTISLLNGTITTTSEGSYRSVAMRVNSTPAFYVNDDQFTMTLITSTVLSSYTLAAPMAILENVPEASYLPGVQYSGPYYCNMETYRYAKRSEPDNGTYTYGSNLQTNIPVFADRESALDAMAKDDFTGAVNYPDIANGNNYTIPGEVGSEEELETSFGGGGFLAPMMTILSGSRSDIMRFADVLFTDDATIKDAITEGLERYGANPIDFVLGMRVFPCNVNNFCTQSTRNDVWFGSYQHHFASAFNEVVNLNASYLNAGTIKLTPIQGNWKDLNPYTTLSAFFPYAGWQELDIEKYYDKTVNVRYYCDLMTGQAIVVTICDGVMTDIFGPFELSTEIPVTGNNFAQWSQGQVRMLQNIGAFAGAGITGIAGTAAGASGGGGSIISTGSEAIAGIYEAKQKGGVRNTTVTKGSYSCGTSNYLPGYIIWRFDIHEMLEPANLQQIYGRPSYESGKVSKFSGFLKCEVTRLNTANMSDSEIDLVKSALAEGIYI